MASLDEDVSSKISYAMSLLESPERKQECIDILLNLDTADSYFLLASCAGGGAIDLEPSKIIEYMMKAASMGHQTAQMVVGQANFNGSKAFNPSGDINYVEALKWFELSGSGLSYNFIGRIYESGGNGIEADPLKAFHSYTRAAELGHDASVLAVALCYIYGNLSITVDFELGHRMLDSLMSDESKEVAHDAKNEKAVCYLNGLGVPVNLRYAKSLLMNAGYSGSLRAQVVLATMYEEGHPLIREDKRLSYGMDAARWYLLASISGFYPEANEGLTRLGINLPDFCSEGRGNAMREAFGISDGFIEFYNGVMFQHGTPQRGLQPDLRMSLQFYHMAAHKGFRPAYDRLLQLDPAFKLKQKTVGYMLIGAGALALVYLGYRYSTSAGRNTIKTELAKTSSAYAMLYLSVWWLGGTNVSRDFFRSICCQPSLYTQPSAADRLVKKNMLI